MGALHYSSNTLDKAMVYIFFILIPCEFLLMAIILTPPTVIVSMFLWAVFIMISVIILIIVGIGDAIEESI